MRRRSRWWWYRRFRRAYKKHGVIDHPAGYSRGQTWKDAQYARRAMPPAEQRALGPIVPASRTESGSRS